VSYPANYKYTKDHEWVKIDGNTALVGITEHAQHQLGDVVFVELPETGRVVEKGEVFGVVESVKAVVDCYMPISGEILEVNNGLETKIDVINSDPHGAGWMVKISIEDVSQANELMDAKSYEAYLAETAE
jgi:glycine cleavage system H protein